MNELLRWLLDLRSLDFSSPGVEFGFAHPLPGWCWALVVLGAALIAWLCYRRQEGSTAGRVVLGVLRGAALVLLAVIIAGPRLLKPNETEEKDWVLVLVDRSASMTIRDSEAGAGGSGASGGSRVTREQQLREALAASRGVWEELGAQRVVVWLGFDSGAYELDAETARAGAGSGAAVVENSGMPVRLGEPVGRRTNLARALEQGLRRAAARPLSGVVVISDGRSVDDPTGAVLRRLEAEKVPVFTVALGSKRGVSDVAIRALEAPRVAFMKDPVPVQVDVERLGGAPPAPGEGAIVELVDDATGTVLGQERVEWSAPNPSPSGESGDKPAELSGRVVMMTKPSVAGATRWSVRVRPEGGGGTAPGTVEDLVDDNNRAELGIELIDRPLRVLYIDGYPRWECRYIRSILIREESIASAVMLLASGRRYLQEGNIVLDALPRTPEEWSKFDVVILGDVWPGVFTTEQLEQIRDRVALAGTGLLFVGGEGFTPGAWRGTPLADLVPFVLSEGAAAVAGGGTSTASGLPVWDESVLMHPTPAADRLGVLRLSETAESGSWWPQRLRDPATGWSQLRWSQRIDPSLFKPTSEVLAVGVPASASVGGVPSANAPSSAMVMSMRFGSGRVLYVATDDTWHWRYGRGDFFPERFWLQLVRLLGRDSVAHSGKAATLEVTPRRGEVDQPLRIAVTLLDQTLVDAAPSSVRVRVVREGEVGAGDGGADAGSPSPSGSDAAGGATELTLVPDGGGAAPGRTTPGAGRTFATTWTAGESGRFRVEAVDPLLQGLASGPGSMLQARVDVWQPDDELRRPQADHAVLEALSQATEGKVLTAQELKELPKLLPNRRVRLAGEPDIESLWDTPLALILMVMLLTAEWVGRRLMKLV